jgi:hypothetical protein
METDMIKHYLTRSRQEKNYISYILLQNRKTRNYNLRFDLTNMPMSIHTQWTCIVGAIFFYWNATYLMSLNVHIFQDTRKFCALCAPYPPSYTYEEVNKHVQPMIRAKLIEEHKVIYIGTICKEHSLADH